MKKELKIRLEKLTRSKHRRLSKFLEKDNGEIDIENINHNSQTKLTHLWLNLPGGWGSCWLPLDGALTEDELEGVENIKIIRSYNGYMLLLSFKEITKRSFATASNETMSVASVRFPEKPRHSELPPAIQTIKGKIPRSMVYEISAGKYAGCYAVKTSGYWSPPLFRASFDCGIYDRDGVLMSI